MTAAPGDNAGLTLDTGALIAFERNQRNVVILLARALEHGWPLVVPAGVLGQVWRDGQQQVRLARLLRSTAVTVEVLDDRLARLAGQLCGARGTSDVIDASVVLCAKQRQHQIVTSDASDLRRLDPSAPLISV